MFLAESTLCYLFLSAIVKSSNGWKIAEMRKLERGEEVGREEILKQHSAS